ADNPRIALDIEGNLLIDLFAAPTPASQVVEAASALADRAAGYPVSRAEAMMVEGVSKAMLGSFEDAHRDLDESIATLSDFANGFSLGNARTYRAWIHRLAGEWPAAEAELRVALGEAQAMGDRAFESFVSCRLAEILVAEERYDDAAAALEIAERDP